MTKEIFVEKLEKHILDAFDSSHKIIVEGNRQMEFTKNHGWIDKDLPLLLPSIRKHAESLYDRWNVGEK